MNDFLLEIGCENLPASYVLPAAKQLAGDAELLLDELRLAHDGIYTTGTPRRIVLIVSALADVQATKTETVTGPPVSRSYDGDGNPTPAAQGFARSLGIAVSRLRPIETGKGEYLGFTRTLKNRKTVALLKERLPALIAGLKFPKTMRWESSGTRFARPVRWIVALYGTAVVSFRFAGVRSGAATCTVPWIDKKRIRITSASSYLATMKKRNIIIDHSERRAKLEDLARRESEKADLQLIDDPALFDELAFMVEEPHAFIGAFPEQYLDLPPEVIITAMKAHQRYFALRGRGDALVPGFLAFIEGKKTSPAQVRSGNEKVLNARLADALFYWREDLKKGIRGLADKLGAIVFIEGVGTIADKSNRVHRLISFIGERQPERRVSPGVLERIALLAKADLASEMVKDGKEFTLLEGLMGSHYARAAGENDEVVSAIREQYLPRTPSDPLPNSIAATYLSVADKIDSICGCFLAGLIPTGSQDPNGLRRQAIGVIRLLERYPLCSLADLIGRSIALYREMDLPRSADFDGAGREVERFVRNRLEVFIKERGIDYDVVGAATQVAWSEPGRCIERAKAIQAIKRSESFGLLITGVKRVGNILPAEKKLFGVPLADVETAFDATASTGLPLAFSRELFQDPVEDDLLNEIRAKIPILVNLEQDNEFSRILAALSELGPPIDRYFDTVLVNCDQAPVRNNRIQFLAALFALFSRYADFSLIVDER